MPVGDGLPRVTMSRGTTRIVLDIPVYTSPRQSRKDHKENELGIVYANDLAHWAITENQAEFPEGSILVREKLAKRGATKPELLAAMIKRERGFNPKGGDWLFLITNGPMTKVKLSQKEGDCLDCHQSQKSSDFVFPLK